MADVATRIPDAETLDESPPATVRACEITAVRQTSRGRIVARSSKMLAVIDLLERVAKSTCTVLVTGETGTGKELAVTLLHDASPRHDGPLVVVNCGAIPQNLVESELFGHVKGAFTGAVTARRGLVAEAEGGTLFLDEIGELPLLMQVKLLRLLQQREYTPVGESRAAKADIRIVAATHRDLAAEVTAGRFREDLYHRLNVIHIRLPALRERPEDIAPLAHAFLRGAAQQLGRPDVTGFAPGVLEQLGAFAWPGNVRALENALERAVVLALNHRVEMEDLPDEVRPVAPELPEQAAPDTLASATVGAPEASGVPGARSGVRPTLRPLGPQAGGQVDLRSAVEAFENDLIRRALVTSCSNKQKAADMLGLKRTTLIEMMKRKGIDRA